MRLHRVIASSIISLAISTFAACGEPAVPESKEPSPPGPNASDQELALWNVRMGRLSNAKPYVEKTLAQRTAQEGSAKVLAELVDAGWPKSSLVRLYELCPRRTMFQELCRRVGHLTRDEWSDSFGDLLKAHLAREPDDPLAYIAKARWHFSRDEFALAEKAFESAEENDVGQRQLDECLFQRIAVKIHAGKDAEVVKDLRPKDWCTDRMIDFCRRHDRLNVMDLYAGKKLRLSVRCSAGCCKAASRKRPAWTRRRLVGMHRR